MARVTLTGSAPFLLDVFVFQIKFMEEQLLCQ